MCDSDMSLEERFQAGDKHALELLLQKHRDALERTARGAIKNYSMQYEDIPKELYQELSLKLLLSFGTYQPHRPWLSWAKTIVCNLGCDWFRHSHPDRGRGGSDDIASSLPDRSRSADEKETGWQSKLDAMATCLESLSSENREVVCMRGQGSGLRPIAARTALSISTISRRVEVLFRTMRACIEQKTNGTES